MLNDEQRKQHYGSPEHNVLEHSFSKERYTYMLRDFPEFFKEKTVIDFGCGWGGGTQYVATKGPTIVIGIDANQEVIDLANKSYANDIIDYRQGIMFDTDLPTAMADTVIMVEVIEHGDDEERTLTLREARRVLKDNGQLYITTPERRKPKNEYPSGSHWTEYDFEELKNLVEAEGFKLVWHLRKENTDGISMALLFEKVN